MMGGGASEEDDGLEAALAGVRSMRDGAMQARTLDGDARQKIMIEIGFAPEMAASPEVEIESGEGEEEEMPT